MHPKGSRVCAVSDRKYTYSQIYKKSRNFGANLRKKFNVNDGDVIAVMLPNVPEFPIVSYGILEAGGIITPFSSVFTPYEIQTLLSLSDPKIIITMPEYLPTLTKGLELAKKQSKIIAVDVEQTCPPNTISFKELIDDGVDLDILKHVRRNFNDVAALQFSSGTTGLPKGVELTHRNIVANSVQQSTECRRFEFTTGSHQDTVLGILPFSHSSGFGINLFHMLSAGVRLVTVNKFQPNTFVNTLEKYNMNTFTMTPPTVLFMCSYPEVTSKHLQHLRSIDVGAAPIPKPDLERLMSKANKDIHVGQIYGLTEVSPVATLSPVGYKEITSVGFALPNVSLRVVDPEMNNLGPNEKGELLIKGPNVMRGYRNNPEANKNTFIDNNDWLRTGDQVSIDAEGAVFVADRMKNLIKVKAHQVPPAELESIIKEIPNISDVAVVGVKDPKTGERPKAFIVRNDKNIKETDIMNYVNQRVAPYKHLKEVEFVGDIPKNSSGKILKRVLIEELNKRKE